MPVTREVARALTSARCIESSGTYPDQACRGQHGAHGLGEAPSDQGDRRAAVQRRDQYRERAHRRQGQCHNSRLLGVVGHSVEPIPVDLAD